MFPKEYFVVYIIVTYKLFYIIFNMLYYYLLFIFIRLYYFIIFRKSIFNALHFLASVIFTSRF